MIRLLQVVESKIVLLSNAMQADKLRLEASIKQCEDNASNLYQEIDKYKQEMREEISKLREQSLHWIDEFIGRLETEAIASITNFDLN
ncbi:hypothetical protein [Mastigocoleus testarum]|uniref:Uncharacterized protein n=1 Tax=Mastigocoleus testarum BC008 TaxID=371196 RepID=A0A0V7ZVD1_9CYAN|nr:hypothetical protein [Mastigocoleus testarum]KST68150.1 hypothetical protein BC008_32535 [Mastigocoleus testarum BC008]KST68813.1 hypothetical protein BC008_34220 [Mastigocoleus testarum BC008]